MYNTYRDIKTRVLRILMQSARRPYPGNENIAHENPKTSQRSDRPVNLIIMAYT